ncbi:MAG: HNH endonuclease [Planctomycetes bacterium]|nr:HNH endonuclease [Planctomycetota bacterium]
MGVNCDLSPEQIDKMRRVPTYVVLQEMGVAAREAHTLRTPEFKKFISYLIENPDGRDRREPLTTIPDQARPVPRLRVALDACFGAYADLHWFKINKTVNSMGLPLTGLFPRVSASLGRVKPEVFGHIVGSLVHRNPDAALMRLLNKRKGKIPGIGLQLFSRMAYAFRRDLYFVIPHEWGTASGAFRFIGTDLRKYCALCRELRSVCDDLAITPRIRGSVFGYLMNQDTIHPDLLAELNKSIGPTIGRATELKATDGYVAPSDLDGQFNMPIEFTGKTILARRGQRQLRHALLRAYGSSCAITGKCPKDLLEVAHISPFPDSDVNAHDNAIILRTDIHTLWDLNLIAINPEDMSVCVARKLRGSIYENLAGRTLARRRHSEQLNSAALVDRWEQFVISQDNNKKPAVMIEASDADIVDDCDFDSDIDSKKIKAKTTADEIQDLHTNRSHLNETTAA